jgi:hypothetical protein
MDTGSVTINAWHGEVKVAFVDHPLNREEVAVLPQFGDTYPCQMASQSASENEAEQPPRQANRS